MWAVTGWAAATWLRLTLALAATLGLLWLVLGTGSGWFWAAVIGAALIEWQTTRALAAEWGAEARYSWWWTR
jgi:ABC-type phosphate transport system auxiliary subunit